MSADAAHGTIDSLSAELEVARSAVMSLDGHKQENLSMKETIDRLRFQLDELRNASAGNSTGFRNGSVSNNLADELRLFEEQDDQDDTLSEADTAVESEQTDEDDYVETVITRRKVRSSFYYNIDMIPT